VSACFYACYTIVLRKSLPDDDEANVALFFGYVGVLCSVVFAPVVAVLAGIGAMRLKTIPPKAYLIILIEGERDEVRVMLLTALRAVRLGLACCCCRWGLHLAEFCHTMQLCALQ
jgi:hypothetical protein